MQHLGDPARRDHPLLGRSQLQPHREQEAGSHRGAARQKSTQQIEKHNAGQIGLPALPVLGQGRHHQKQDQQRRHRFQRTHEQVPQQAHGSSLRHSQAQHDPHSQTAEDPKHQAALIPAFDQIFHTRLIFLPFNLPPYRLTPDPADSGRFEAPL